MLSALNFTFALWKNRYGVRGGGGGEVVEVVELGTGIVGI